MLLFIITVISCETEKPGLYDDNLINATVTFSSGQSAVINASRLDAKMQCVVSGSSVVDGRDQSNRAFRMSVRRPLHCITTPGIYPANVDYRPDISNPNAIFYHNGIHDSTGTVTYTVVKPDWVEGHFSVKAYHQNDSVVVAGTFKGRIQTL